MKEQLNLFHAIVCNYVPKNMLRYKYSRTNTLKYHDDTSHPNESGKRNFVGKKHDIIKEKIVWQ